MATDENGFKQGKAFGRAASLELPPEFEYLRPAVAFAAFRQVPRDSYGFRFGQTRGQKLLYHFGGNMLGARFVLPVSRNLGQGKRLYP
jgi:hypothetical protein